jgi:DNA-binding response OmpR family regulator
MYAEVAHLRYEEEEDRWVWEQRRERRTGQRVNVRTREDAPPTYEVVLSGRPIPLEMAEFQIIRMLAQRPYHAFRVQEILDMLRQFGIQEIGPENLREAVVELRTKLGFFRDFIQSVPHIGYRFRP